MACFNDDGTQRYTEPAVDSYISHVASDALSRVWAVDFGGLLTVRTSSNLLSITHQLPGLGDVVVGPNRTGFIGVAISGDNTPQDRVFAVAQIVGSNNSVEHWAAETIIAAIASSP